MKKVFCLLILSLFFIVGCKNYENLEVNNNIENEINEGALKVLEENNYAENNNMSDIAVDIEDSEVIEIKDKMFLTQVNDIFYNAEEYLGKTIKYEGIFNIYEDADTGNTYYSVYRNSPGCCGDDGFIGFEVIWDNEYPEDNDWVELTGVLEEYEEDGYKYLRLNLISLNVLTTRGQEFVTQ